MNYEREPNNSEDWDLEQTKLVFSAQELHEQRFSLMALTTMKKLEDAYASEGEKLVQTLRKRFLIDWPSGSRNYPFAHQKVVLRPKDEAKYRGGIRAVELRYETLERTQQGHSKQLIQYSRNIVVSMHNNNGQSSNYLLNDNDWQPFASPDDLIIGENGEILGLRPDDKLAILNSDFTIKHFSTILAEFEPDLQINAE